MKYIPLIRWTLWSLLGCLLAFWSLEASFLVLVAGGFGYFPGCPCCASVNHCTNVCDPAYNNSYQIDVSGMANGSCLLCNTYNGSFVINPTVVQCEWETSISTDCGGIGAKSYGVQQSHGANYHTFIYWIQGGTAPLGDTYWDKDHGASPVDCSAFSALNVPQSSSGTVCDNTGSTATITSL